MNLDHQIRLIIIFHDGSNNNSWLYDAERLANLEIFFGVKYLALRFRLGPVLLILY